jgi:hypothetical protein
LDRLLGVIQTGNIIKRNGIARFHDFILYFFDELLVQMLQFFWQVFIVLIRVCISRCTGWSLTNGTRGGRDGGTRFTRGTCSWSVVLK